ncbi:MAG: hypothetical protein FWC24_00190 [Treponema sp.]|nr:hypothetical protein [Treponema sp.]
MKKSACAVIIATVFAITSCTTADYTANMTGASDYATVAVKDFVTLGIVTVHSKEIHHSGPFGIKKRIEGSKITYSDLMHEAVRLEADDIINVRIDVNSSYTKTAFDWITGWTRVYTHTGTALAIKYTGMLDSGDGNSQLSGIPKAPEATSVIKSSRSGTVEVK